MDSVYSSVHYWLVDHPTISKFEWIQGQTFGSSPQFLIRTVLTYLILTFTFHRFLPNFFLHTTVLRLITAVHNLILCLLSFVMAVGCTLSTLSQMPQDDWTWPVCFPVSDRSPNFPPKGPTFFWAYVFYFSKILEFMDTLLILLSDSRNRRLSFLHVYHHSVVIVMCYLWLSTSQSLFPVALVTNASVHVLMYGYYLLSAMGRRPRWKRLVTDFQILQFVFSFAISGLMLYYHFSSNGSGSSVGGCSGILGWCFNAVFNASLLTLFLDFHFKNYAKKKKGQ